MNNFPLLYEVQKFPYKISFTSEKWWDLSSAAIDEIDNGERILELTFKNQEYFNYGTGVAFKKKEHADLFKLLMS